MFGIGDKKPEVVDPMIGKCFSFRHTINDPEDTYVKILIKDNHFYGKYSGIEVKSFGFFGGKNNPTIEWEKFQDGKFKLYKEITSEEFNEKTKPILEKLGLDWLNNTKERVNHA